MENITALFFLCEDSPRRIQEFGAGISNKPNWKFTMSEWLLFGELRQQTAIINQQSQWFLSQTTISPYFLMG
jgi:hypothetical protein